MLTPEEEKHQFEQTAIAKEVLLNRLDKIAKKTRKAEGETKSDLIEAFQNVTADLLADPFWGRRAQAALKQRFDNLPDNEEVTPLLIQQLFKEEVGDYGNVPSIIVGRLRSFIAQLQR